MTNQNNKVIDTNVKHSAANKLTNKKDSKKKFKPIKGWTIRELLGDVEIKF